MDLSGMLETVARLFVFGAAVYCAVGILLAIPFILRGVNRIDPLADQGTLGFRLLIFPASVALWPLLIRRWRRGNGPPEEHNPHRDLARRRDS